VPVSDTVWGLPGALSVIETEPVRVPFVKGLNLTLMVQFAPGATLVPQVFVWLKLLVAAMLVTVKVPVPELVRVTVLTVLL
jgi:hypothetical protein